MNEYIVYVADRAATREGEALMDYFGIGELVSSGRIAYEVARDELAQAFKDRNMSPNTAKVYVSQAVALAELFDDYESVATFADEVCGGSRSLKRIYDATRVRDDVTDDVTDDAADESGDEGSTPLVDVILANLAHLTDAADIARVRDAAAAMLVPTLPTLTIAV